MNNPITKIDEYLETQAKLSLLRFITCGSVDDGKSTLIGRLLFDAKQTFEDQLTASKAIPNDTAPKAKTWIWRCWWMA